LKTRRFLGSRAVSVLNHWFQSNRDYPYPDDERTDRLAREAGRTIDIFPLLSLSQTKYSNSLNLIYFSYRNHSKTS